MTEKTQLDLLIALKTTLGCQWDEVADFAGINRRTMKSYRMPEGTKGYRPMNRFVWDAIVRKLGEAELAKQAQAAGDTYAQVPTGKKS